MVADRIAVMYLGRIVEIGNAEDLCAHPAHPYTKKPPRDCPGPINHHVAVKGEPANPLSPRRAARSTPGARLRPQSAHIVSS